MTVLYILHTVNWDGTAHSLLNMINSLKGSVKPIVLFRKKSVVYDIFMTENIDCISVPFCNNIKSCSTHFPVSWLMIARNLFFNALSLALLFFKLHKYRIDIVHSNSGVLSIGFPLTKMLGVKHVVHLREFQEIDFSLTPLFGWERFYKNLNNANAVIAITKAVYNYFNLENHRNSYQLWNAVLPRKAACIEPKEKYFLFCSAILSENKGIDFCLEAFGKSGLSLQGYKLYIIGKDEHKDLHEKMMRIIGEYKISENVHFIGNVSDIKLYMLNATAFLMCSKNEGFGRVTAEAMIYGCPVIARNTGGSPEFIANGITGFLFDDMESCIKYMRRIAMENCSEIIHNAQNFALEYFTEENYGKKILEIYKSVID